VHCPWAVSSAGERFVHTEEVGSSILPPPTRCHEEKRCLICGNSVSRVSLVVRGAPWFAVVSRRNSDQIVTRA
jgi:hypothetical protein